MKTESETKRKLLEAAFDLILSHSYGSVSVDDICKRAGVQKGSFYHFFPSKSELAVATFDDYWENFRRPQLDRIFSTQTPPLERFARYCEQLYELQKERQQKHGRVVGCPFNLVGSELSAEDEKIRKRCQENGEKICQYFTSALRDAIREGLLRETDIPSKARELYSLTMGTLMQARICNDLEMLKTIKPGMDQLLGLLQERRTSSRGKNVPTRTVVL